MTDKKRACRSVAKSIYRLSLFPAVISVAFIENDKVGAYPAEREILVGGDESGSSYRRRASVCKRVGDVKTEYRQITGNTVTVKLSDPVRRIAEAGIAVQKRPGKHKPGVPSVIPLTAGGCTLRGTSCSCCGKTSVSPPAAVLLSYGKH